MVPQALRATLPAARQPTNPRLRRFAIEHRPDLTPEEVRVSQGVPEFKIKHAVSVLYASAMQTDHIVCDRARRDRREMIQWVATVAPLTAEALDIHSSICQASRRPWVASWYGEPRRKGAGKHAGRLAPQEKWYTDQERADAQRDGKNKSATSDGRHRKKCRAFPLDLFGSDGEIRALNHQERVLLEETIEYLAKGDICGRDTSHPELGVWWPGSPRRTYWYGAMRVPPPSAAETLFNKILIQIMLTFGVPWNEWLVLMEPGHNPLGARFTGSPAILLIDAHTGLIYKIPGTDSVDMTRCEGFVNAWRNGDWAGSALTQLWDLQRQAGNGQDSPDTIQPWRTTAIWHSPLGFVPPGESLNYMGFDDKDIEALGANPPGPRGVRNPILAQNRGVGSEMQSMRRHDEWKLLVAPGRRTAWGSHFQEFGDPDW